MEILTLKNGSQVPEPLVKVTMLLLSTLMERNPIAFYELVMKCRDSKHELLGNTSEVLSDLSLIQSDGCVHDAIRDIMLSASEGKGLDMTLRSPVATAA